MKKFTIKFKNGETFKCHASNVVQAVYYACIMLNQIEVKVNKVKIKNDNPKIV